jgi:sulfoxide reductase heme-binding subunit YedZ
MMAFQSSQALWYLTRGTGLVALVLLTSSVALGVTTTVAWRSPRWPRFVTLGLHRNLSLLAVTFLGVHIASTVLDGFAPISWLDAFIPFHSPYRPIWLGLGALAVDLLIAVVLTSLLRRHLSFTAWRAVHWTAWMAWPFAVIHGLGTGSDAGIAWAEAIYLVCTLVVLGACWWRIAVGWPEHRWERTAAAAASVLIPLAVLAWTVTGPLQVGWARRAGTPPSLLHSVSADTEP